jgi:hypothetical protein
LDVLGLGRFEAWDVLRLGRFAAGTFCSLDIMSLNVLYLGRFAAWTLCLWMFFMCTEKISLLAINILSGGKNIAAKTFKKL